MSLRPPEKVQKLQETLHAKAKEAPGYRFYALSAQVDRAAGLGVAYRSCRHAGGAPGVDGERFEDIEMYGIERWLGELTEELRKKTYQPQPVRRVWIPKPDGSKRPLGIPTPIVNCTEVQRAVGMGRDYASLPSTARATLCSAQEPVPLRH